MPAYDKLRLYTSDEAFVLQPATGADIVLFIDRVNHSMQPRSARDVEAQMHAGVTREVAALLGVIHLLAGPYLLLITKKQLVGRLAGSDIFKATEIEMIPFARSHRHLSEAQSADEKSYVAMINSMLASGAFHFSYSYDLTHTQQRLYTDDKQFAHQAMHERADERFYWNKYLHQAFRDSRDLRDFLVPVIHGFVSINQLNVKDRSLQFVLISRRSVYRSGTRFNVRGIDESGHVANFVETEQIVEVNGQAASYVQTRGSVPLFWSQRANIKYKPSIVVNTDADHFSAFRKHFDEQQRIYGKSQGLLSLVDHKGGELRLHEGFAQQVVMAGDTGLRFIGFDFHKECKNMKYQNLKKLLDQIAGDMEKQGYFFIDNNKAVRHRQNGVFRTNCADCLDRTNVVQSMIARLVLQRQLQELGVIAPGELVEQQVELERRFKNVWADNADAVSFQYSGTGALKTDFTRTGKRSLAGAMQDGYNSAIRYYKNNFADGFRQDGVALFLGTYRVDPQVDSPLREVAKRLRMLPLISAVVFAMLVLSLMFPATDDSVLHVAYVLFWVLALVVSIRTIVTYGNEFVDHPRLTSFSVKEKIF
ncbi:SACM1L protein [Capsaspora owczarzaki ATCC 30864]|uniref:SACM1L protein n=1 Tax=Capsaspora owczarzaki (strain ATCC 30864) TaxID=595528 RepID=A0A0D2WLC0_CAPO3|nr:SACM1L protein [Capsaspora owczarzaki ATCC 30864]KJE90593.1 SACM1L protein [Capsaspora owczarzaki ATCC 30864]|eukprot:XP_004364755.2 SACM1L protein [Capsaspora owczarzaki ATCC 30864]